MLRSLLRPGGAGWAAAFWTAVAAAFILAVLPHPPELPGNANDKVQHMLAFAVLALLARLAFPRVSMARMLIGLGAFGALIEIVQAIPALHRDSDWRDWLADLAAAGAVVLLGVALQRLGRGSAGT